MFEKEVGDFEPAQGEKKENEEGSPRRSRKLPLPVEEKASSAARSSEGRRFT